MSTIIQLHNIFGIWFLQGTDDHGNAYTQFEVDASDGERPEECAMCGANLESGRNWLCLDDNNEYCDSHISY
jgi:hypothetical protein